LFIMQSVAKFSVVVGVGVVFTGVVVGIGRLGPLNNAWAGIVTLATYGVIHRKGRRFIHWTVGPDIVP